MPQPRKHTSHAERQAAYRKRSNQALARLLEHKGLPPLPAVPTMPGHARWRRAMSAIETQMTQIEAEMQSYYEERSQRWQESERAEEFQQKIDDLAAARDLVTEWIA
jgi:hypothetical protein